MTLTDLLPPPAPSAASPDPDAVFTAFSGWAKEQGLDLYPHQEEALIEVMTGANVILSTPTGSGKSLVAAGAHFAALADGRRTFYTAPIKALVSEKFFALCDAFGAANVGMMTGDASVNARAPIICCTAEVLANIALRDGADADAGQVVMDEFHFYSDPARGWAWQVPLIELPRAQFVLMSATLGDVTFFRDDLTRRTGRDTAVVANAERPVPLIFSYLVQPLHETLEELLSTGQAPVYIVYFTQAQALEQAQALMSVNVCTKEEKARIAAMIGDFRFASGFGKTLSRLVRHGIGVHHAGMLPKYRRLVETLAQAGLLKVICGTDTLGVGINVPIRTVLFTSLSKYDGKKTRLLQAREFHQIAGRAGRAGFDTVGRVVVQAPEHVIENEKALAKAGDDPKARRKVVKKKPPEGFIGYGQPTFERLRDSDPEPLTSSFTVTHAMILNVIERPGNAFAACKHLLRDNHEPRERQRKHVHRAIEIYRALLAGGVVERLDEPDEEGRHVRVTVDLQYDFALNQPLSPFALAAIELLPRGVREASPPGDSRADTLGRGPGCPREGTASALPRGVRGVAPPGDTELPGTYPLDVLSVIEATLDDPRQVLSAQQFRARGEAVAAMKAEGIDYETRLELLDDVTWPKPLRELLEAAYEIYRRGHPWVADYELSPKSVVRDMYERAMTFGEYVHFYGLNRSEGIVLRYLADAYRALRQTVPEEAKTEELSELIEWLGELVRQVDSSLIDEWEKLTHPGEDPEAALAAIKAGPKGVTSNPRAFRVLVRNALFRRVTLAALRRYDELGEMDGADGWRSRDWEAALEEYFAEYDEIGTGPDARGPAMLVTEEGPREWTVRQIFDDPAGDHDWGISAIVDLAASDADGTAVIRVTAVGPALFPGGAQYCDSREGLRLSPSTSVIAARLRSAGCVFAEDEATLLAEAAGTPEDLEAMIAARVRGLPLEQVVGWAEFRGLRIAVDPGVFVPRRRSEFLVETALRVFPGGHASGDSAGWHGAPLVVVDVCCGTGALGVAVAAGLAAELHAADLDPAAVACARRNVEPAGGHVYEGDLFAPLPASLRGTVAIAICNAPYVPSGEIAFMPPEARLHEALLALDGGPDGLAVLRRACMQAPEWLAPGGTLLVETSGRQAAAMAVAMTSAGLLARVHRDDETGATVVTGAREER